MPFNPNPFTEFQKMLIEETRKKIIEIRDPDKEVLDNQDFDISLVQTKRFGPIPKIRFSQNAMTIKHEIMEAAGYKPIMKKASFKDLIKTSASAFDKHWDALMAGLIKGARRVALFNQMFAEDGQKISEIIRLVQCCIETKKIEGRIHNQDKKKAPPESYIDKLKRL